MRFITIAITTLNLLSIASFAQNNGPEPLKLKNLFPSYESSLRNEKTLGIELVTREILYPEFQPDDLLRDDSIRSAKENGVPELELSKNEYYYYTDGQISRLYKNCYRKGQPGLKQDLITTRGLGTILWTQPEASAAIISVSTSPLSSNMYGEIRDYFLNVGMIPNLSPKSSYPDSFFSFNILELLRHYGQPSLTVESGTTYSLLQIRPEQWFILDASSGQVAGVRVQQAGRVLSVGTFDRFFKAFPQAPYGYPTLLVFDRYDNSKVTKPSRRSIFEVRRFIIDEALPVGIFSKSFPLKED